MRIPANQKHSNNDFKIKTFPSGAQSREGIMDYSLCPTEVIDAITSVFVRGIEHGYERDNWKRGNDDAEFIRDRINHAFAHFLFVLDGTGDFKDIKAILCNLAMVTYWREHGEGLAKAFPRLGKVNEEADKLKSKYPTGMLESCYILNGEVPCYYTNGHDGPHSWEADSMFKK